MSAWSSGDAEEIGALFSDDAVYSYRPWENDEVTVRGRDSIVASWLDSPDPPSTWEAAYWPYAVDGDKAVAVGWSKYEPTDDDHARMYHNAYLLEFDEEGLCKSFHEFYFLEEADE